MERRMGDTVPSSDLGVHSFSISTSTVNVTTNENFQLQCDYINTNYSIVAAILCIACFIFGVLYTFFGMMFFYLGFYYFYYRDICCKLIAALCYKSFNCSYFWDARFAFS